MALIQQNLTTYTKLDPNLRITNDYWYQGAFIGISRNEDTRLYKDFGINYFNTGDFEHQFKIIENSSSIVGSAVGVWGLANSLDDISAFYNSGAPTEDSYWLQLYCNADNKVIVTLIYAESGGAWNTDSYNHPTNLGAGAWITITRVGTTLLCYIYSDSGRTTLIDTLSIVLNATASFRYHYAINSYNSGTSPYMNGESGYHYISEPESVVLPNSPQIHLFN